jgi:hypothetical protein
MSVEGEEGSEDPAQQRERVLTEGDAAWGELCAALDAAPAGEPVHDPGTPGWTSRDVYTHFVRMHAWSAEAVRCEIAGRPLPWPEGDEDELNERWREEDSGMGLEEARRRAHETRRGYRDLLMSLSPEQWSTTGLRHSDDIAGGHYRGHLRYLGRAD